MNDRIEALQTFLAKAEALLKGGEVEVADRTARAVSAIVKARRDVAELEAVSGALTTEMNEEALRAELRRRLAAYVESDGDPGVLEGLDALAAGPFPQ